MKIQLRLIMLTLLCAVAGTMWGATTYSHTFAQGDFASSGSSPKYFNPLTQNVTLSGVAWNLVLTPKSGGNTLFMGTVDGTKGLQFGSGSNPASSIKLSTSGIPGTIKSVLCIILFQIINFCAIVLTPTSGVFLALNRVFVKFPMEVLSGLGLF